ncbi:hypothetical protein [Streptantibioticus ferralitis]|uniref:Uncharacterized protein n=1 Tax=Streptantibioticus ferralitis TaxID=236510 RepID=A0ABT5Z0E8_9ACTN|nr:hypothetical protein [Streptantibioticus ferralitis]MDF2257303.1 hypothetical protein [Streptantibioticus ferralitis]
MNANSGRVSQWFSMPMPLGKVAGLLDIDPAKAPGLVRAGRFPCRVTKVRGKYVATVGDVMEAMGIEDPVVQTDDLRAGADFAKRWD